MCVCTIFPPALETNYIAVYFFKLTRTVCNRKYNPQLKSWHKRKRYENNVKTYIFKRIYCARILLNKGLTRRYLVVSAFSNNLFLPSNGLRCFNCIYSVSVKGRLGPGTNWVGDGKACPNWLDEFPGRKFNRLLWNSNQTLETRIEIRRKC